MLMITSFDLQVLEKIVRDIQHVSCISRVLYDLTPKPPGTIEWEWFSFLCFYITILLRWILLFFNYLSDKAKNKDYRKQNEIVFYRTDPKFTTNVISVPSLDWWDWEKRDFIKANIELISRITRLFKLLGLKIGKRCAARRDRDRELSEYTIHILTHFSTSDESGEGGEYKKKNNKVQTWLFNGKERL